MKPIRYWEATKVYKWGCPECLFKTYLWETFWMHSKECHGVSYGSYHISPEDYELKEMQS